MGRRLVKVDGKKEETMVVKVQRMFPNCQKYKKCCTDDDVKQVKFGTPMPKIKFKKIKLKITGLPLDFAGY